MGFERLLAELSIGFMVGTGDVDAAIRDALGQIVSLLALDVGAVLEIASGAGTVRLTHTHCMQGMAPNLPASTDQPFPWLATRLLAGDVTRIAALDELPEAAASDRRSLEQLGVRSVIVCPIVTDRVVTGAVAFAGTGSEHPWPDDLVEQLCLVGQVFAGALARRRLEARLVEEREFAVAVLDSLPGLFFMGDEENRYVHWNKNAEVVAGYTGDDIRGHYLWEFVDDVPGVQASLDTAWRTGAMTSQYCVITKDGRRIPYFATGRTVTLAGRRYIVGLEIDVSALKAAEEHIRRQQAELAHVARVSAMGELAAAIAHELNQPLTAIRTNAQVTRRMLAADVIDVAELKEALTDITDDAVRAGEIIRRLRDLLARGTRSGYPST